MDTSKYLDSNRKAFKRDMRTDAYRELQKRRLEDRAMFETKLRERNAVIKKLAGKLNMSDAEVRALTNEDATTEAAA
jgi:hypothetical protein